MSLDDFRSVNQAINWNYSTPDLDVEEMWGELSTKLEQFELKVPKIKVKITDNGKILEKLPWESASLLKLRSHKNKMWHMFEQCPTTQNLNIAQGEQSKYEKTLRKNLATYEGKITSKMKDNPKRFFSYLNSKRKVKNDLCALKKKSGGFTETAKKLQIP